MAKIKNSKNNILSILCLTIGSFIAALSLNLFLIPNTILDGGVTGISILISKVTNIHLSILVVFLNIPLLLVGYRNLGKRFLFRSCYAMISFSIFLYLLEYIEPFTEEMLLATVFGGAILGLGVGLVIYFGGCVDGTESIAIVISKKMPLSVGQVVFIFNLMIYTIAGFVFGFDRAMYSLLTYFITFKVVDFVSSGLEKTKIAMIITKKGTTLSNEIYKKLGRTTTSVKGTGFISGEKEILYCVLTRIEVYELKHLVEELDQESFIAIMDVTDIIGDHIKSKNKNYQKERDKNETSS